MKKITILEFLIILAILFCPLTLTCAEAEKYIQLIEFRDFVAKLDSSHQNIHLHFNEITYDIGNKKNIEIFGKLIREELIKLVNSMPKVTATPMKTPPNMNLGIINYRVDGHYWEVDQRVLVRLLFVLISGQSIVPKDSVRIWLDRPKDVELISPVSLDSTFKKFKDEYSSFKLDVHSNVEDRSEVAIGKPITIYIESEQDCYFILMNRDVQGRIGTLYPKPREKNKLKARERFELDDIYLAPPLGWEVLFVVASTRPIEFEDSRLIFQEFYDRYISKELKIREIRRGKFAVDWIIFRSVSQGQ